MTELPLWTFIRDSAQIRFDQRRQEATLGLTATVYQAIMEPTCIVQHIWHSDLRCVENIPEQIATDIASVMALVNLEINDRLYQGRSLDDEHIGIQRIDRALAREALLVLAVLYGVHGGWNNPIIFNDGDSASFDLYTDRPLDEKHLNRYIDEQGPVEEVKKMLSQIPQFFALRRQYNPRCEYLPYPR